MSYNLCIVKPNQNSFSETFVAEHIKRLAGNKKVIYGGAFPVYDHQGNYLIKSKIDLLCYLIQKRIFKKKNIKVRTKALANYLKREKIDIVFAEYGMVGASIWKACEIAGVPLIIHFHGADAHHNPTIEKYKEDYHLAFEYASYIICVSKFMFDALIKLGAPLQKLVLNPYGVDFEKIGISHPENNLPTLFFAGRFVEKKAPKTLVNAFYLVKKEIKDAKLIMAGDGPLLKETKILAKSLGLEKDIEFPGVYTHQKVLHQMNTVRAFVQHSVIAHDGDSEGTPNSILEASASGLPVISTFHAGIKEAVIDQITGLLSKENDIESFANHMIKVLKDKNYAHDLGIEGVVHIKKNYDLKFRISALDNIIQKAIYEHD